MCRVLQALKVLSCHPDDRIRHAGSRWRYPRKGRNPHLDRPVFNTVADAVKTTGADVSIIFCSPAFAADAVMGSRRCWYPAHCMHNRRNTRAGYGESETLLIRKPGQVGRAKLPGVITAEECKVGIMPGFIFKKGRIGIVSKSGTLLMKPPTRLPKPV